MVRLSHSHFTKQIDAIDVDAGFNCIAYQFYQLYEEKMKLLQL